MTEKATVEDWLPTIEIYMPEQFDEIRTAVEALVESSDAAIAERDQCKRFYKELVNDFMPETECLPGSKCDSYGHEDNCPVVNAQASVHNLRLKYDAAMAQLLPLMIERDQALKDCEDLSAQNEELRAAFIGEGLCSNQPAHWCRNCLVWGIDPEPIAHKPDCVVGRLEEK